MIVPLVVFFSLQRYFVQGLLAGSVKYAAVTAAPIVTGAPPDAAPPTRRHLEHPGRRSGRASRSRRPGGGTSGATGWSGSRPSSPPSTPDVVTLQEVTIMTPTATSTISRRSWRGQLGMTARYAAVHAFPLVEPETGRAIGAAMWGNAILTRAPIEAGFAIGLPRAADDDLVEPAGVATTRWPDVATATPSRATASRGRSSADPWRGRRHRDGASDVHRPGGSAPVRHRRSGPPSTSERVR